MTAAVKTSKTAAGPESQTPGFDAFAFPDMPDVMSGWLSMTSTNVQAWQTEWTNFLARRLEHDRQTLQRFARCRDPIEAAKVQLDWSAETMAAYFDESRRLAAIATDTTHSAARKASRVPEVA